MTKDSIREVDRIKQGGKPEQQSHLQELSKSPERQKHKELPSNRRMEAQFEEKIGKHDKEIKEARAKKSEIIEGMVTKDFPIAPGKKRDNVRDFHYGETREFAKELKKRDPLATKKDIRLTTGFHDRRDNQAFVKDRGETLVTALHEKLHQKSESGFSTRLNEGLTEHFARKEAGAMGDLKKVDSHGKELPKARSEYEKDVEIVGKLEATVGKEPMQKAYFEGKSEILKKHTDAILGDGSFQKLNDAVERKDYETASSILEKK